MTSVEHSTNQLITSTTQGAPHMSLPIRRTREEVVKHWVAALRSKKYKQVKGALRTSRGYCCLGVLCDLMAKDGGPQWRHNPSANTSAFMGNVARLAPGVRNWLGLDADTQTTLIHMNDDGGSSFEMIADYIEKKLL